MTMRMSFCLKAIKTLDPRDLNALTDAIEGYVTNGIDTAKAEQMALDDVLAGIRAERAEATKLITTQVAESASPNGTSLTHYFGKQIRDGNMPKDNPALRKMVEAYDRQTPTPARMKEAQEVLEAAIVKESRRLAHQGGTMADKFAKLLALYQSQPLLNVRTSTSIDNQAYSTPAPLALLASDLAGINDKTTVHEPTGGTGMLLIEAAPKNATVNELDDLRAGLLREQGFTVTQEDATERQAPEKSQNRVIANPPFGPIKDAKGESIKVKVNGYTLGQIDHLIAARALETMKDDGAATLIIGANQVPGGQSNNDLIFLNWLYSHYNVTSHFEVDGKLYARQGAGWPVRVITIEGREQSDKIAPQPGVIQRANTWEQVYERYEQGLASGRAALGLRALPSGGTAAGPDVTGPVPDAAGVQTPATDRREPEGSARSPANESGQRAGTVGDSGAVAGQRVGKPDRAERPGAAPAQPDQVGRGPAGRPGTGEPAGNPRTAGVAPQNALTPTDNEFQATYTPRSSRKDANVLIPVNMRQPVQDALSTLEDAVGDIDEYARKQLGYETTDELHNALMGLQVDSVASAIYQMGREKGTIIADQTGIGKGRQAAAIIRWAVKNGRIPIFASAKPSLFTDMYGDLADIGTNDVNPLILNSSEWISGPAGEKLFANRPSGHRRTLEEIASSGMLPDGRNALFMTYSQINVDNIQRRAVEALAPRAIFILDESHNAGGDSATGDFIKNMLDLGRGVVYLSATYAKRPDNMPLYFKTDMGEAVADDDSLMTAMELGGLPLQTVVSNNLVKAGQMFRRERSFDGVEIATVTDTENREVHEKQSDAATEALRAIVAADRLFHTIYFKARAAEAAKEGKRALESGNGAAASVNHTEFSSVVHNFVRQMLLGLEANKAADLAIAALQQGQKPLIAVENTMGSFLAEYAESHRIRPGDSLGSFDYRNVLTRALDRTRFITIQKPNGDKVKQEVKVSELDPVTQLAYEQAQRVIGKLDLDIPVSPIDWMRDRLTKAGFTAAEITGRSLTVDYTDLKKPKLAQIDATEQKDKVRTTRLFNSGKLDAIILNVAGSTDISLHASEKFSDQRQRVMIVAQAAQDINIFMQMLGRIHRTGQVALPAYKLLNADLPAVKRPIAVLSRKMKSLNANTSSNTESATSVKALDMLNKYGDQVVQNYLADNPTLGRALGLDSMSAADETSDEPAGHEDLARKMTGRLALLPVQMQRDVYADLEQQYSDQIDYLNKTNQNDLEPRTMDFDAKEMASSVLFEGTNPETPFGQDAIYNEFSIKAQGIPPTPAEVRADTKEHLGDFGNGDVHADALIRDLNKQLPAFLDRLDDAQKGAAMNVVRSGTDFMRTHAIGSAFRIEINGEPYAAVVTNLRNSHKGSGNPFSMSKIQVTLAVNGALRGVTVPATKFGQIETSRIGRSFSLDSLFKEGHKDERQTAKIITGNLLGAYGELKGVRGTIISFTKEDGTVDQGILLPKAFAAATNTQGDYRLPNGEAATLFLRQSINRDIGRFGIQTRDGIVRVLPENGEVVIKVPKSKAKGGKFFLDTRLRSIVGDFVSVGNFMIARVDFADAPAALDALMKKQALYTLQSMADEAKTIIGQTNIKKGTAQTEYLTNPDRAAQQATINVTAKPMQTASSAAQWLAESATEPWVREVAGKIAPYIDSDTAIRYLEAGKKAMLSPSVGAAFQRGIFGLSEVDPVSGRASLYFKYAADRPVGQEDMLHELLHAATQRALSITRSATIRAELESIRAVLMKTFDQVLTSPRASEQARNDAEFFRRVIEDEHELLAYGMTSRTFRKWAQSIDSTGRIIKTQAQPTPGAAPKMTMWQKFVDLVRSLVGLSKLYEQRLNALMSRREADALAFRTANTPETLAKRLDALLQQTLDLRVGADEYSAGWSPRKGTSVASDQPFYSEMARQVERSAINTAPAGGWSQFFRGLVNKGTVKADEVAWSGVEDWLATQPGKVTREQVAAFLDGNGVKVTEKVLSDRTTRTLPDGWRVADNGDGTFSVLDEESEEHGEGTSEEEAIANAQDDDSYQATPGAPKYGQYTLPGGTNYREVLLTLPNEPKGVDYASPEFRAAAAAQYGEKFADDLSAEQRVLVAKKMQGKLGTEYKSGHWEQPNVLAHIRLNDRTDSNGKRVLFVEEIQSDWGQAGKKGGFRPDLAKTRAAIEKEGGSSALVKKMDGLETAFYERTGKQAFVNGVATEEFRGAEHDEWNRLAGLQEDNFSAEHEKGVPAAPFVGKTDAWVALAIKRVIKMAVDEGYDRVAFVNGEQSVDRYKLSNEVERIEVVGRTDAGTGERSKSVTIDMKAGGYVELGVGKDGTIDNQRTNLQTSDNFKGKNLADVIGKDLAKKIIDGEVKSASGDGLNVGGEGMKAFYDKIVPNVAKDVLRKLGGGAMTAIDIAGRDRAQGQYSIRQEADGRWQVIEGERETQSEASWFKDKAEAQKVADMRNGFEARTGTTQPGFDITPAMRQKAEGPLQMFGTAEVLRTVRNIDQTQIRNTVMDALTSHGSTNLWDRTVGTQYAKAQKNPKTFGRVFDAVQNYIKDITIFANAAADKAPDILPKLDSLSDLRRKATPKADIDLAGAAAFAGTLKWARDENGELVDNEAAIEKAADMTTDQKARVLFKAGLVTEAELKRWQATPLDIYDGAVNNRYEQELLRPGVVFSDAELSERFKMNKGQIDLYRQFRASVDQSLDDLGRTELVRLASKTVGPATTRLAESAKDMAEAAAILSDRIDTLTEAESSADARDVLTNLRNDINEKANRVAQLKADGYAPLMRFGEHTLTVTGENGEIEFFGLYESNAEANRAARQMKDEFPRSAITQGKMSKEAFKLFKGVDLNALELFAETTGMADNSVYQDYLRLTKNNRSAMKRMIHRKGISGFNENTARVLASFVTSNARMASGNLHMGEAVSAAAAIPKEMGDLKDEATKLVEYVQNPGEEAAMARGLLFVNFIGGSAASAMVNLTQPFTMSLPYLSQFGGLVNAGKHLLAATRAAGGGKVSPEMQKVLHDNADLVSPQEIHHLNSEVQDQMGNHPLLKKGLFLWGSMFSLSEQFNRRVTFIAAYQTALEQGMADPTEFARKAVIETQGLYNKGNKPNWSRGAIGATVMTFKQFSIHYLEFLTRMWKSGPEGKKAVGAALAILVLAAGAGGLPFADDLDDLIDTLAQAMGYDFSSKRAKRKFIADQLGEGMAEFLTRGASGISGMPIDVSLRMGLGNLLPMTGVLLRSNTDRMKDVAELGGAAGSLLKTGIEAGAQALHGEFAKAGLGMAPLAIQNMAKAAEMFNTGEYRNTKGQMVTHVDLADSASKFLGFQPAGVAKESSRVQEAQRSIALARNVESEIAGKWAQGLSDNRPELVTEARAELADWNAKNPEEAMHLTMQQIIHRVRDMRATREQRTVKAAPKEMRSTVREALQ